MTVARVARTAPLAAALTAGLLQAGCQELEAQSSRTERLSAQSGLAIVSSHPARAVIAADGREVVVEPAGGFCVEEDALSISGAAAFALLSDCQPQGARAFPGIVTVSVSNTSMIDPGTTAEDALAAMRQFLATDQGLALLGRSGGPIRVEAARDVGDGLYVLVEDGTAAPLPILSPRFWRAFVELNGRMAMVTISSFRDNPLGDNAMLGSLARQVVALRRANRSPASAEEMALAALAEELAARPRTVDEGSGDFVEEAELPTASQSASEVPGAVIAVDADPPYAGPAEAAAPAPAVAIPLPEQDPPYLGPASQG